MAWFRKDKKPLKAEDRREVATEVFDKCQGCGDILYRERLAQNLNVCPNCGYHLRIGAQAYVGILLDEGSFTEFDENLKATDPLGFVDLKDYPTRIAAAEAKGKNEALISGSGTLNGIEITIAVMDFDFIGGSMGSVVGEKIARAIELATRKNRALIIISSSSGARMQEGMLSLLQMAKTCGAIARHNNAGLPYLSILTHPTTGGVTASFATIGDINLAEPRCMIGFAGPRVVKETTHQDLPPGFQTAEFMLEHGLIDSIVERRFLRERLVQLLGYMMPA